MITAYGETVEIGDWIVWTPYNSSLSYGKVVGITKTGNLKVQGYSIHLQRLWTEQENGLILVKTKAVVRAKLTCIK